MSQIRRAHYLYGVTTQAELIGFLRTQCVIADNKELESIVSDWRSAAQAFASIQMTHQELPESIRVDELSKPRSPIIDEVESSRLFRQSFSLLPYSIQAVEIDKIVAGQRYVDLSYVDELTKLIPPKPNADFLADFCLSRKSGVAPPSELQLGPNVYSFKSESTDFRFLGGYPKPLDASDLAASTGGGEPVAAVVLLVGYGSPQVNVFKVGGRVILNNGFHRLYALRSRGVTTAPVVVQHITNSALELPPVIAGLPSQYQTQAPRPSMMKDFLNPKFTREVKLKARDRSVQIQWNINQVDIPK